MNEKYVNWRAWEAPAVRGNGNEKYVNWRACEAPAVRGNVNEKYVNWKAWEAPAVRGNGNEKNESWRMREASCSEDGSMNEVRALVPVESDDTTVYDARTLYLYCTGGYPVEMTYDVY